MILIDQHKMSPDDKASKYLPGMDRPDKKDITLAELMLHYAGFMPDNPIEDFRTAPSTRWKRSTPANCDFKPGTDYEYSDNNFIVMGAVVQKVAGQPLDVFASENMFRSAEDESHDLQPACRWG